MNSKHPLDNNNTIVYVFYDEMTETLVAEQVKITTSDLVQGIGGTLSLMAGFSLLTLVELFDALVHCFISLIERQRKRKKANVIAVEVAK